IAAVDPVCYFMNSLLDAALHHPNQAKFLAMSKIDKYYRQGVQVCTESHVVVWRKENENVSDLQRSVEQIKHSIASTGNSDANIQKVISRSLHR
ncbi:hypothetical protein Angca_002087, partial [Angiostrongylus cantonensis]